MIGGKWELEKFCLVVEIFRSFDLDDTWLDNN